MRAVSRLLSTPARKTGVGTSADAARTSACATPPIARQVPSPTVERAGCFRRRSFLHGAVFFAVLREPSRGLLDNAFLTATSSWLAWLSWQSLRFWLHLGCFRQPPAFLGSCMIRFIPSSLILRLPWCFRGAGAVGSDCPSTRPTSFAALRRWRAGRRRSAFVFCAARWRWRGVRRSHRRASGEAVRSERLFLSVFFKASDAA